MQDNAETSAAEEVWVCEHCKRPIEGDVSFILHHEGRYTLASLPVHADGCPSSTVLDPSKIESR